MEQNEPERALLLPQTVADLLDQNRKTVLSLWENRTRQIAPSAKTLETHILIDALPEVLDELVEQLKAGKETARVLAKERETGREHAKQRVAVTDYTLTEVLQEYRVLREVIFEVLESHGLLSPRARDIILRTLDIEIRYSATQFSDIKVEEEINKKRDAQISEAYMSALVESTPVGLALLDTDLRYVKINPILAKMNGISIDDHLGKTVDQILPRSADTIVPMLKQVLQTGQPVLNFEISLPDKDHPGRLRYFLCNYYAVSSNDVTFGIGGSVFEITEQKNIEFELQQQRLQVANEKEKFEAIFKNSPAAMALWRGPSLIFEMVNPTYQAIFPDRQLVGKPFLEACPEFVGQPFADLLKHVLETGETFTAKEMLAQQYSKTGELENIYYDFTYARIDDASGNPYGVYDHAQNVTDRVMAKANMEQSLQQFRTLADAIPQMVWTANPNGELDYLNQRWSNYTGIDPEKGRGFGWKEAIHPDDLPRWELEFQKGVSEGRIISLERRIKRHDGKYEWHISRAVPFKDQNGQVIKVFGTSTNIEEQKRVQSELEEVNFLRERFTNTLTHDLRNPLGAVKISVQLALRQKDDVEKRNRFLYRAIDSADRIDKMIGDLLDVSRIRAGEKLPLHIEACNLKDIAMKSLDEQALTHGDRFALKADGNFDGYWDCEGIQRVLDNLIGNAIKYGAPDSKVTVTLMNPAADKVSIRVHNFGNELQAKDIPGLFNMFKQVKNSNEISPRGWGIGLTLVKGIIDGHGGNIEIDSGKGQGTTFVIEIPKDCRS